METFSLCLSIPYKDLLSIRVIGLEKGTVRTKC